MVVGPRDLVTGLITADPPHAIPDGAAQISQNVDYARVRGRIAKRRGIAVNQAELAGGNPVSTLYQYKKSSGTDLLMAAANNDVYSVSAGTWTSKYTGAMAGANVEFATFEDTLIMVGATETTRKWDGVAASFSALLGTPPANAKYIAVYKGRVWIANHGGGKSRINYCVEGNAEDWTTAGQAGFYDIDPDDGDEITGLIAADNALYIFKRRTVYMLIGWNPTNFEVRPVKRNYGCAEHRSLVNMGPFVIYLSDYGLHSLSTDKQGLLHPALEFDLRGLTKTGTQATRYNDLYILAYDSDANGRNDSAYVLDTLTGAWTRWTNINARSWCLKLDNTLLSGGADNKTIVRQHDTTDNDEGVAIEMKWRSKKFGWGDISAMKTLHEYFVYAKPIAGKTLTVRVRVDGVQVGSDKNVSLTARQRSGTDEDIKLIGESVPSGSHGRFVEIEFYNNETSAPIEIYEFQLHADVSPPQKYAA